MKFYFQFFSTFFLGLLIISQTSFAENLVLDDAIVKEARSTDFQNDKVVDLDPKCKVDGKLDGRTESTVETTEQSQDVDFVTTEPENIVSTTPQEVEVKVEVINEFHDEPGSYPWLVEVMKNGKHLCAGSLIDHSHVLTTAYCIYKLTPDDFGRIKVDIGFRNNYNSASRDLYEGPSMSQRVKKIIYHRFFNVSNAYNDIALLQLEHPIVFDKLVQPILITGDDELLENSLVRSEESIVGWTSDPDDAYTPTRNEEILSKKSTNECRGHYMTLLPGNMISDSMMCAGGERESTTCYWTFGSPLLTWLGDTPKAKPVQIGLFSWGIEALLPKCAFSATNQTPMVFTRISSYTGWIRRNLKH